MKTIKNILIGINLIGLLLIFNFSVKSKETILKEGEFVLLALAPIDPRSLMQGDYMDLRYAMTDTIAMNKASKRGFCIVRLYEDHTAQFVRLQENRTPLNNGEILIEYTSSNRGFNIGSPSYFFQEGMAEKYDSAFFGGLKIDTEGNSVLIGLYNRDKKLINPK
jgi:uncharacterized membrane-anchored protein